MEGYAVRALRPLARRAETMARPARVRIRVRKPCLWARRRLLGWKVRLPLATVLTPCSSRPRTSPVGSSTAPKGRRRLPETTAARYSGRMIRSAGSTGEPGSAVRRGRWPGGGVAATSAGRWTVTEMRRHSKTGGSLRAPTGRTKSDTRWSRMTILSFCGGPEGYGGRWSGCPQG